MEICMIVCISQKRKSKIIVVFYLQVESIVTRCLWFLSSDRVLLACSSAWVSLQLIFLSNEVDFTIAAKFVKLLVTFEEEIVRSCSSDSRFLTSFLLQIWWALSTWLFSIIEVGEVDAAWFDELFSLVVVLLVWPVWTREAKALANFRLKLFLINPLFSSQFSKFWWWFSGLLLKLLWLLFTFWFVWWILWRQLSDLERKLDLCGKVTLLKDFLIDWHTLPLPALSLEFCWLLVVWCGAGCVWLFWLFVLTFGFKHFGRCKAVLIKDADLVRSKWRFQRSEIWKKNTVRKCSFSNFSCMFLNPNIFFQILIVLIHYISMRNLQEQVKKAFCYQKLFWSFKVWINCSSDFSITRTFFSHSRSQQFW